MSGAYSSWTSNLDEICLCMSVFAFFRTVYFYFRALSQYGVVKTEDWVLRSHPKERDMTIRLVTLAGLLIAVLFGLTSIPDTVAQDKAQKGEKAQKGQKVEQQNIQGTVQIMSKDTSTITVRTTDTASRQVVYKSSTKFLYGHSNDNKPGTLAQVKESYYISCSGTFNAKNQLEATECVYRETR